MNRYPTWKNILVLIALLIGILYSVPNLFGESPAVQVTKNNSGAKLDATMLSKVESTLHTANVPFEALYSDEIGVKVRFASTDLQIQAKDVLQKNLGEGYTVALNLLSRSPSWLRSIGAKPMYLGLDLRGGVHFLLQVDMKAALNKTIDNFVTDFRLSLRKEKIHYMGVAREGENVQMRFENAQDLDEAESIISKTYPNVTLKSADQGAEKLLTASLSPIAQKNIKDMALKQNILTLNNRINELHVAEPIVQQQGEDRIVVQLPGVQDTAKAKEILGRTATLEVHMVVAHTSGRPGVRDFDPKKIEDAQKGIIPFGTELLKGRPDETGAQEPLLVSKDVVFSGENLTDANPTIDQQNSGSVIAVRLDPKGARSMQATTAEGIQRRMAVVLIEKGKKEVLTAPTIQAELSSQFVITGMKNLQEAQDLALLMRAGALAAPMEIVEERTVGPSMGEENIKRGIHSTLWGFAAIAMMMIIYYMVFGGVSVAALGVNLVLLVAILSMLQATLTLPGLAAIALALGMAIDANVLINERIREELRNGNTPQASIHAGYDRAFDTILDSNVTTFIVGIMLFSFGSGPIQGFAVVHLLGIITSMFSAVFVSRAIVNLIYGYRRKVNKLSIGQVFKN